jgi:predicted CoA-binding protein
MSFANPDAAALRRLLLGVKTIAVVGLSPQPNRPSHRVALAMQGYGYRIVPVRPLITSVLGETAYASLADIPFRIDLVNVFRAADHVPAIVDACVALHCPAMWIQQGIRADAAAERARTAGMTVVMDRCIYQDYVALFRS